MPPQDYRYYCLDAAGRIHDAEWFQAADDQEAVALIEAKHPEAKCEIWKGDRLVASLPPIRLQA